MNSKAAHISKPKLYFLLSKNADPYFNMAADNYFFEEAENDRIPGILRLYDWKPYGISIGSFFKTSHLNTEKISNDNIKIVRRITGGNAVLHRGDITYSIILNKKVIKENSKKDFYYFVAGILRSALSKLNITSQINTKNKFKINDPNCYSSLSEFEIASAGGSKIIGSAQKILRSSMLQHGSFFYNDTPSNISSYLNNNKNENIRSMDIQEKKYDIIINTFKNAFSEYFEFEDISLDDNILEGINRLISNKYSKDEWNFKY